MKVLKGKKKKSNLKCGFRRAFVSFLLGDKLVKVQKVVFGAGDKDFILAIL